MVKIENSQTPDKTTHVAPPRSCAFNDILLASNIAQRLKRNEKREHISAEASFSQARDIWLETTIITPDFHAC